MAVNYGYPAAIVVGGVGGGGGLVELLNVDFTAEATQDLTSGGDGNKTIAGKTFYADNTAGATKMAVTNGVGLELDVGASALFGGGSRTAPIVGIRLPDILAGLDFKDLSFIRAWIIFSDDADVNFEQTSVMFERKHVGGFVGGTWHHWRGERIFNGTLGYDSGLELNGTFNGTTQTDDNTTDDVLMVKLYSAGKAEFYTGQSSGGDFPTTMRLRTALPMPDDVSMRFDSAAEMAIAMASITANASANLHTTITRLKIDAK